MNDQIVYLNGEFLPVGKAKISVLDRGFLFGDGVYEVIPFYRGSAMGLMDHLARLQKSLDGIQLQLNIAEQKFPDIFGELLRQNHALEGSFSIYVQITRGFAPERSHAFPKTIKPTIFALTKPIKPICYEELARGKCAVTREDIRWKLCHIKSISLLPSILLFQQAVDAGCDETILLRDGYAIEGTSSNLFIVEGNTIITPPLTQENLCGVTRNLIIQLAKKHFMSLREEKIPAEKLPLADELWISSSTRGIFPITKLDGELINGGKIGSIWDKMIKLYIEASPQIS